MICCLFCRRMEEAKVVRHIAEHSLGLSIYPQKKEPFCRQGEWRDVIKPLLPGDVFVYSEEAYPLQRLLNIDGVLRCLTYGSEDKVGYLTGKDRQFALWILENNGIADKLKAVQEGSCVRIVDGLLKDYNGKVEKIKKQKRMAYLSLKMAGTPLHVWMGYECLAPEQELPDDP